MRAETFLWGNAFVGIDRNKETQDQFSPVCVFNVQTGRK